MNGSQQQTSNKIFLAEFDKVKGIVHFTATNRLHINTPRKMIYIFKKIDSELRKYSHNRRLYMIVDFNKIIFDFDFSKEIVPYLNKVIKDYLHQNGVIAYGKSISLLTLKMTYLEIKDTSERFFNSKYEAYNYIDSQIIKTVQKEQNKKLSETEKIKVVSKDETTTTDHRQACKKQIIVEFDQVKGIIHFTSKDKLYINAPEKLACINEKLISAIEKHANGQRLYMVIDFNVFLIDLDFAGHIFPFLENLCLNYLHNDGILAYGQTVSRVSFKLNFRKLPHNQDHYFNSKEDVFAHIDKQLEDNKFNFDQEALATTPIKIDTIEITPPTDAPDRQL